MALFSFVIAVIVILFWTIVWTPIALVSSTLIWMFPCAALVVFLFVCAVQAMDSDEEAPYITRAKEREINVHRKNRKA